MLHKDGEHSDPMIDVIVSYAKNIVDDVIFNVFHRLDTHSPNHENTCDLLRGDTSIQGSSPKSDDYHNQDIPWLTINEFSVAKAEDKINEFVKTWVYEDSWLYCVDYLGKNEQPYAVHHKFRVRWSVPTRRKPVPRATASVYFTFVVSTIKPKDHVVDVLYVIETNRLIHK